MSNKGCPITLEHSHKFNLLQPDQRIKKITLYLGLIKVKDICSACLADVRVAGHGSRANLEMPESFVP